MLLWAHDADAGVLLQLWWGNAGHGSSLRFEYCKRVKTGLKHDPLDVEEHLLGEVVRTLSDDKLAEHGCVFTTDLSGLFQKHGQPSPLRTDLSPVHKCKLLRTRASTAQSILLACTLTESAPWRLVSALLQNLHTWLSQKPALRRERAEQKLP